MVNISNPLDPQYAGCFEQDGYVHDAQCVTYHGPDDRYFGREVGLTPTLRATLVKKKEKAKQYPHHHHHHPTLH